MKNILVISTSLRKNSNSEMLGDAFMEGAKAANHHVEKITLKHKTISFCQGCLACQKTQKCSLHDDANEIVEKMKKADVLVFVTPIYYYEMSGQLKTLLDRANPLYGSNYAFKEIYMLTSAAEDEEFVPKRAIAGLTGWIDCFEKAKLVDTVFAGGVNDAGDISGHPSLEKAYKLGKGI